MHRSYPYMFFKVFWTPVFAGVTGLNEFCRNLQGSENDTRRKRLDPT